jgi:hypothetical protein
MSAELALLLLAEVGAVLLDLDGPVCSIFAGYPAPKVAAELVDVLRCSGELKVATCRSRAFGAAEGLAAPIGVVSCSPTRCQPGAGRK